MAPDEDPDEERHAGGRPLPPDDRLWRHPSELGPSSGGPHAEAVGSGDLAGAVLAGHQRTSTRSVLTGACLAGALVALGVLMLTRPMPEDEVRRSTAARTLWSTASTAATTFSYSSSLAEPATAAAPIRRIGAAPLGSSATRPGRLEVQVTDDGAAPVIASVQVGGPAHRAGLEVGDQVVAVNEVPVADAPQLTTTLSTTSPAEVVAVEVIRRGDRLTVLVVLG